MIPLETGSRHVHPDSRPGQGDLDQQVHATGPTLGLLGVRQRCLHQRAPDRQLRVALQTFTYGQRKCANGQDNQKGQAPGLDEDQKLLKQHVCFLMGRCEPGWWPGGGRGDRSR